MKKITALVVSVLMAIAITKYCHLIFIGKATPNFSTWLIFASAATIGMWIYIKSGAEKDMLINMANTSDLFVTWIVLIFLVFFGKEIRYKPNLFEIFCIINSVAILLYWKISRKAEMANLAINALLTIGYFPTIIGLYNSKTNTESLLVWTIVWIAQTVSLYIPIKKRDWLAIVYSLRAVIFVGIILVLMIRIEFL